MNSHQIVGLILFIGTLVFAVYILSSVRMVKAPVVTSSALNQRVIATKVINLLLNKPMKLEAIYSALPAMCPFMHSWELTPELMADVIYGMHKDGIVKLNARDEYELEEKL